MCDLWYLICYLTLAFLSFSCSNFKTKYLFRYWISFYYSSKVDCIFPKRGCLLRLLIMMLFCPQKGYTNKFNEHSPIIYTKTGYFIGFQNIYAILIKGSIVSSFLICIWYVPYPGLFAGNLFLGLYAPLSTSSTGGYNNGWPHQVIYSPLLSKSWFFLTRWTPLMHIFPGWIGFF